MRFTWEKTNPEIRCPLDFFLISESLCPNALEAKIQFIPDIELIIV